MCAEVTGAVISLQLLRAGVLLGCRAGVRAGATVPQNVNFWARGKRPLERLGE